MVWAGFPRGRGSWAGARDVPGSSGGGVIIDPANPGASGWRWIAQTGPAPWAGQAWGGGGQLGRATAGGLTAFPDPDVGVINLTAWWTEASYLRVVRVVEETGERTAVRGGDPLIVGTVTRRNYCTNPSFETGLSGWLAGVNTTLTQDASSALAGQASAKLTATAAGAVTVTVPVGLPIPDNAMAISFALRLSAAPSGALTLTATWQDSEGKALVPSAATIPAANLTAYVGRWDRLPAQTLIPPGAAATGTLTVSVAGLAAGGSAWLDAVLIERAAAAGGPYFDGDSAYAGWTGTRGTSTSALAPVSRLIDAEAPLDVPVYYELRAPAQPSSLVRSETVTLSSVRLAGGRATWLSHPSTGVPVLAKVTAAPELTRAARRGVYAVLGRREPVAVATSLRAAPEGAVTVLTETLAERDRLLDMLDDGQPLLLRAPQELGYGPGWWISVGDVKESAQNHYAGPRTNGEHLRLLELPFSVVSAPASASTAAA